MSCVEIFNSHSQATWVSTLLNLGKHPQHDRQIIPMKVVKHVATGVSVPNGISNFPEIVRGFHSTSYCTKMTDNFRLTINRVRPFMALVKRSTRTEVTKSLSMAAPL